MAKKNSRQASGKRFTKYSRFGTNLTRDRAPDKGLPLQFKGAAKRGSTPGRRQGVSLPTVSIKGGGDHV